MVDRTRGDAFALIEILRAAGGSQPVGRAALGVRIRALVTSSSVGVRVVSSGASCEACFGVEEESGLAAVAKKRRESASRLEQALVACTITLQTNHERAPEALQV